MFFNFVIKQKREMFTYNTGINAAGKTNLRGRKFKKDSGKDNIIHLMYFKKPLVSINRLSKQTYKKRSKDIYVYTDRFIHS